MTTTDRRDADDATFTAEMDRPDRLEVADPWRDQIADVLLAATTEYGAGAASPEVDLFDFYADALIAALKPAPGTDVHDCARCDGTGCESDDSADERSYPCQACNGSGVPPAPGTDSSGTAVQRVLIARCENFREDKQEPCTGLLAFGWGQIQAACNTCGGWCGIAVARWIEVRRAAVAGPQRDGVTDA